tara:strand:- start:112 stop:519 length:408 start_codon:yes stop_codon:yes gene_type:complete
MVPVSQLKTCELRVQVQARGWEVKARNEMISDLKSEGIMEVDPSKRVEPLVQIPKQTATADFVLEKHGKTIFYGSFKQSKVTINDCLNIDHTELDSELEGEEGDMRRCGRELFMYRSTDVIPGWYPLQFGSVKII